MKVLVIGAAGQLGTDVIKVIARHGEEGVPATRQTADITDESSVAALITAQRPDAVVNCAAYHDVAGCEENPELATAINTVAVGSLARMCREVDKVHDREHGLRLRRNEVGGVFRGR